MLHIVQTVFKQKKIVFLLTPKNRKGVGGMSITETGFSNVKWSAPKLARQIMNNIKKI